MKLINFSLISVLVILTFYLLIVGQDILQPVVIALVFWYLINLVANSYGRLKVGDKVLPSGLCFTLSLLSFIAMFWAAVKLISMNVDGVLEVAPIYQVNLEVKMNGLLSYFGIQEAPTLGQLIELINLGQFISAAAGSLTSIVANSGIILIYLTFLFIEQKNMDKKLSALIADEDKEQRVRKILQKISNDVRKYVSIKLIASLSAGTLSYIFMMVIGVDFAAFWALLIFLLNFIPTIGSIVATIFPALIALVQFDTLGPFFLVAGGLTGIQILIGNILEPKFTGRSLNLSPTIILLNLSLWGLIWGIPGMFLCVPFLVISMIVFSHLPQTRTIAILLSSDGRISDLEEEA
ncbi:MAG: permease [SAR86 cluster bacterium]|uniref:Permease n=1 Tax=SAR86 cluster bacterium TaxID=2030880 RepID=A0A2A5CBG6_9GAMM|nr:AI-2E family transporter [Gammaproteobacteria bacterium AH-315-E17]PCJ41103.1 MAG: permease [SAR86 cluster bacterium]